MTLSTNMISWLNRLNVAVAITNTHLDSEVAWKELLETAYMTLYVAADDGCSLIATNARLSKFALALQRIEEEEAKAGDSPVIRDNGDE